LPLSPPTGDGDTDEAQLSLLNQFCSSVQVHRVRAAPLLPRGRHSRSASFSTASRSGPATSRPAGFWPFQWIEGDWLLALSVLLIAASIWLVQRRAA
jgi:hypothetical protein